MRGVFRHDRRAGLCVGGQWGSLGADRARSAGGAFGGGSDAAMIRVVLPAHLRTLARTAGEVELEVEGPVTQRSAGGAVSDAAGDDPRPRHASAPAVREVFCVRRGLVARVAGCPAARGSGKGGGAFSAGGGDCGRVGANSFLDAEARRRGERRGENSQHLSERRKRRALSLGFSVLYATSVASGLTFSVSFSARFSAPSRLRVDATATGA
ncbi:hypothetical protein SBA4_6020002 [Candidatus Sulfopaludibacter sp. SbA4]|nr:hypothetical protein SBA4_6020002 [Candidatus Sulfopaludibacter sp. SbA4]